MVRRPLRPNFGFNNQQQMLAAMSTTRHSVILCGAAEPHGSDRAGKCDAVKASIDALAESITGDPAYYHLKPAQSRPLPPAKGDEP